MNRKDIFMTGFKSKLGFSFTHKDMEEFETIIDFYEKENARLKDNYKQLEKFICYEQNRLLKATSHIYQDSFDKIKLVNSDIFEELKKVENKMKELFKEN